MKTLTFLFTFNAQKVIARKNTCIVFYLKSIWANSILKAAELVHWQIITYYNIDRTVCIKKTFIAVEISSNLCGITGVKVWDP